MKKNILNLAILTALGLSIPTAGYALEETTKQADKPNVIVMFLDDAGYADIESNGGKYPTPNIDRIAKEGQNWKNYYVSSPISSPSRAGLLTARLGVRNGMYGKQVGVLMPGDKDGLPESEVTIAEMLKDNGYSTALFGKWHLGEEKQHYPTRHGFDISYGPITSNDIGWTEKYRTNKEMMDAYLNKDMKTVAEIMKLHTIYNTAPKEEMWQYKVLDSVQNKDSTYSDKYSVMVQTTFTQELTNKTKSYIEQNKENPFFIYLAYPQNHVPLFVSPEFKGKTATQYGDVMQEIDWSVGEIVNYLEKADLDENTLVVFTSDNGPWDKPLFVEKGVAGDAGVLAGGKNRTLEGGNKVPAVFYWPGHIKPGDIEGLGSTLDLLPTVASITGSELPSYRLDGLDLSATLLEKEESARKVFPYYMEGRFEAIRVGDWKLFLNAYGEKRGYGAKPTSDAGYELYNLKDDPSESNNLAKSNPEKVAELLKEAESYQSFVGDFAKPLFDFN